jgi:6-phosphogluconolactonase
MTARNDAWREFASGEALANGLAATVAENLRDAISERGRATLAVSGGTTPGRFFDALSSEKLDWDKVTVTLIDERFVPESSDRSNARLVRARLLRNEAANATFAGLYRRAPDIEAAAKAATAELQSVVPLDVAVLGMGSDGHTASLFPDAAELEHLLDPATPPGIYVVHAPSAGEPRLTWPLSAIVAARALYLHIEGTEKRKLAEAAHSPATSLVVGRVLGAADGATIFWAPAG